MFLLFQKRTFDAVGRFDERITYGEDEILVKEVPRKLFGIVPGLFVHTSRRSFEKRGYKRVIQLALLNAFNLLIGNRKWFYKEHHWF
jgi:hypothetical protein